MSKSIIEIVQPADRYLRAIQFPADATTSLEYLNFYEEVLELLTNVGVTDEDIPQVTIDIRKKTITFQGGGESSFHRHYAALKPGEWLLIDLPSGYRAISTEDLHAQYKPAETFDEVTLVKVREALNGVLDRDSMTDDDIINALQNAGILFRERMQ